MMSVKYCGRYFYYCFDNRKQSAPVKADNPRKNLYIDNYKFMVYV